MLTRNYILIALVVVFVTACGSRTRKTDSQCAQASSKERHLEIPTPPAMIAGDSARMDFVASHYWDNFDFADTVWIADTMALGQTFGRWASLLTQMPPKRGVTLAENIMQKAAICPQMLLRLVELSEDCFRHPNSPFRNEDLFIAVSKALIATPQIDSIYKVRYEYLLELALKNRPGTIATDLTYTTAAGNKGRLSALRGEYTLLLFYNPECHDCARVKQHIEQSALFASLTERLAIVAIYPDANLTAWREHLSEMPKGWIVGCDPTQEITRETLYDLSAIPTLYLLDNEKRVILKDAPVEQIEEWLKNK